MSQYTPSSDITFNESQVVLFLSREELKEKIQTAKEEGMRLGETLGEMKVVKQLDEFLQKRAMNYYTQLARFAYEVLKATDNMEAVKLLSARVRTSWTFDKVELLFLIETSPEQEFEFTKILNKFEKMMQKEIRIESNYVNTTQSDLDHQLIQTDYPNSLELALIKNAFEKLPTAH